ncbi:MAG TPA: peptidase M1, partial [Bacteroidetes bacterium]|nr:peptidase M1 [Bacteroidota bacterium]
MTNLNYMKFFLLHISILFYFLSFGQKVEFFDDSEFNQIVQFEQKNATGKVAFKSSSNTSNYDLKYHRLEWTVDPEKSFIEGNVISYFEAKGDLSTIIFDLSDNMTVSQVTQRGVDLGFIQNFDDELRIDLPQNLNDGVLDSLTISYSG